MGCKYKIDKKSAFNEVRIIIYFVIMINGVYIQYFAPFHTLCEKAQNSCIMCGMRHAINYLFTLNLRKAYESNPGIIVIIALTIIIIMDVLFILKHFRKKV